MHVVSDSVNGIRRRGKWFTEVDDEFLLTGISSFATLNLRYGSSTYATIVGPELRNDRQ
ncbi:hypothetical protein HG15A2_48300 [Adhaeretor mobilis]|uniref:Uncharacterized protein n=1 Tax=Adhaeretor mobilis TaxID=1930276 RepID=A0A517N3C4_9BACT|nr:hypothetical protein HG15A2_48300 [Adhaeretor mobilis]